MARSQVHPDGGTLYRLFIQPLLFQFDSERAHHLALWLLQRLAAATSAVRLGYPWPSVAPQALQMHVAGLHFPNPVGLAAGFDKSAVAVLAFPILGFGFVEIGTITPRAQAGNALPRLFRLPADEALLNRMGFNNDGAATVARRLKRWPSHIPIGVNLGKNADTPLEEALKDYCACLETLYGLGDYAVINVSSPNTPGLRALQSPAHLHPLLSGVQAHNRSLAQAHQLKPRPLFMKIAPDLAPEALDGIVEAVQTCGLDGIIATNTTTAREGLTTPTLESGGLSGRPLRQRSTEVVRYVCRQAQGSIPLIGVGGIFSAEDAYEKICAGASLVQLYTGLIYRGPGLPRQINAGLMRLLHRDGFTHLSEAVGSAVL